MRNVLMEKVKNLSGSDSEDLDLIGRIENWMDEVKERFFMTKYIPGFGDLRDMFKKLGICIIVSAVLIGAILQLLSVVVMVEQSFSVLMIPLYALKNLIKVFILGIFLYIAWFLFNYMQGNSPLLDEERGFEYAPTNEYGSARPLAGTEYNRCIEEAEAGFDDSIILGYGKKDPNKVCYVKKAPKGRRPTLSNPHIAASGGSGAGKSFSLARPAIFQAIQGGRSFIITETSGELFQDTSEIARKHGYDVKLINYIPDSIMISDSCNYIKQVVNGDSSKASTLATVILENTTENRGFWDDAQKNVLTALILLIDGSNNLSEDRKNLGTVLDYIGEGPQKLCARITALPDSHPAKRYGQLFVHSSQQVQESALFGLGVRLQIFMEPKVRNAVKYDEVSLSAPGQRKCAYYVNISDTESTLHVLSALFFNFTFVELGNVARRQRGNPRLPVDVDIILDEFTNIGTLNDFDTTISTVRKYGIRLMLIFQDIGQVMNRYPNVYASILSNCALSIYMGGNDAINNPKYYEKLFGTATIVDSSETRPVNKLIPNQPMINTKKMFKTKGRPIYTEDEIINLDSDYLIVKLERHGPLKLKKFDYREHPLYKETDPCNIYDHVPEWQMRARTVPYVDTEDEKTSNMNCDTRNETGNELQNETSDTGSQTSDGLSGLRTVKVSGNRQNKSAERNGQPPQKDNPNRNTYRGTPQKAATKPLADAKTFEKMQNAFGQADVAPEEDEEYMLHDNRKGSENKTKLRNNNELSGF